jgi:hypothetical protein
MSNIIRFNEFLLERVELTNQTIRDIYKNLNKNPKLTIDTFRRIFMSDPNTKVDDLMKAEDAVVLQSGVYSSWFVYNTQYFTSEMDGIPYHIFHATTAADPTSVMKGDEIGRIGNYTKWMLHQYATTLKGILGGQRRYKEDLYKIKDAITKLISNKTKLEMNVELPPNAQRNNGEPIRRIIKNPKDINTFKTIRDLLDFTDMLDVQQSKSQELKMIKSEGAEVVHNDDDCFIVIPKTYEAAKLYGANTRWCTTQQQYFDDYSKDGYLFVVITKENNEKYQFHFQSSQYMDAEDDSIDLVEFLEEYPVVRISILEYAIERVEEDTKYVSVIRRLDKNGSILKTMLHDGKIVSTALDVYTACELYPYAPEGWLNGVKKDDVNKLVTKNGKLYLVYSGMDDEDILDFYSDRCVNTVKQVLTGDYLEWEYEGNFNLENTLFYLLNSEKEALLKNLIIQKGISIYDEDDEEDVLITAENFDLYEMQLYLEHDECHEILNAIEISWVTATNYAYHKEIYKKTLDELESSVGKVHYVSGSELVMNDVIKVINGKRYRSDLTQNMLIEIDPDDVTAAVIRNREYEQDYADKGVHVILVDDLISYQDQAYIDYGNIQIDDSDIKPYFNEQLGENLPELVMETSERLKHIESFSTFKNKQ